METAVEKRVRVRRSAERGKADFGWLKSNHTFSFGRYYDPKFMGFGPLRVINEDHVAPGGGFPTHPHDNMEILTYVLDGALEHKDSMGFGSVIRPGDVQRMSAGTGVSHSEFNASKADAVHFLQIWIEPDQMGLEPSYEEKRFAPVDMDGKFQVIASPDSRHGSVKLHQDATISVAKLQSDDHAEHRTSPDRGLWLQVARGSVDVEGETLVQGDAIAVSGVEKLNVAGLEQAEILLFDVPLDRAA